MTYRLSISRPFQRRKNLACSGTSCVEMAGRRREAPRARSERGETTRPGANEVRRSAWGRKRGPEGTATGTDAKRRTLSGPSAQRSGSPRERSEKVTRIFASLEPHRRMAQGVGCSANGRVNRPRDAERQQRHGYSCQIGGDRPNDPPKRRTLRTAALDARFSFR
jgi:hypothetical protein